MEKTVIWRLLNELISFSVALFTDVNICKSNCLFQYTQCKTDFVLFLAGGIVSLGQLLRTQKSLATLSSFSMLPVCGSRSEHSSVILSVIAAAWGYASQHMMIINSYPS